MSDRTFRELYQAGEVTAEQIDDFVERWHLSGPDGVSLHEFLGFSWAEYGAWVQNPSALETLLSQRS